uniref:Receptor expression-enhancing protein n=1 Tax=Drosophila ananassae TaxID=7217 RepID=D1GXU7_DROAN|nr:CG11697-PA [Drosophila ananassae]CBE66638.1 CG11697-PA [Drosophila ananassae]
MIYSNVVRLLSLVVGCLYPAFASYKILNGQRRNDEDMRIWMSYWIVYGVFLIFDFLSCGLAPFVPFLDEIKLVFLCWLLPSLGAGNQIIYEEFLRSFFSSNESCIDQALTHATLTGSDFLGQLVGSILGQFMAVADSCFLTRSNRSTLQITPSIEDIVNKVIAQRRIDEKRMPSGNHNNNNSLEEESQTNSEDRDSTIGLNDDDLLNESESDLLLYHERNRNLRTKDKPQTPPKPKRQPSLDVEDPDLMTDYDQYMVSVGVQYHHSI